MSLSQKSEAMMSEILLAVIGCIGGGGIMTLILYPQTKRAKDIENESKQSDEWRKLYEEAKAEMKEKEAKIDGLYEQITKHRDEKAELRKRQVELEVENAKLTLLKCVVPECSYRDPKTGY